MFSSGNYKSQFLLAKLISGNECAFAILTNFLAFIYLFLNEVNLSCNEMCFNVDILSLVFV